MTAQATQQTAFFPRTESTGFAQAAKRQVPGKNTNGSEMSFFSFFSGAEAVRAPNKPVKANAAKETVQPQDDSAEDSVDTAVISALFVAAKVVPEDVETNGESAQARPELSAIQDATETDAATILQLAAETTESPLQTPQIEPSGFAQTLNSVQTEAADSANAGIPAGTAEDIVPQQENAVATVLEGLNTEGSITDLTENTGKPDVYNALARMPKEGTPELNDHVDATDTQASQSEQKIGEPYPLENASGKQNENTGGQPEKQLDEQNVFGQSERRSAVKEAPREALPVSQFVDIRPEKLISAEELSKTPGIEQPVAAENLFDAMVEKLEFMNNDGQKQMTIQLKPDNLGKIAIELTSGENGLSVRVSSNDQNVKHMIDTQVNALISNLSEKGIKIESVDVVYAGSAGSEFLNSSSGKDQEYEEQQRTRNTYGLEASENALDDIPDDLNELLATLGLSSVGYRA